MRKLIVILLASCTFYTYAQAQVQNTGYSLTTIATELNQPWSVAFLPNGDYLVALRVGQIVRISASGEVSEPLAGTPETLVHGQGGYFDVVLDPDFEQNATLYLSFAHGDRSNNATRVVKAQLRDNTLENVTPIFTTNVSKDTGAHYGGRLAFLPDDTLLLTTGDGFQYRDAAQIKNNQMGKTIRFNRDGSVPSDNPFVSSKDGAELVWSYGHRNPQGLVVDPATGIVYQHEHGPKGGDEVNVLTAGANYGWPVATYGVNYSGALVSPHQTLEGVTDGIKVWVPSIAPSGLAIMRGNMFPEWDGDLFVGALVDQEVRHLTLQEGKVVSEAAVFPEIKARIRDVRLGPDGSLYVLTDGPDGMLYRVSR